MRQKHHSALSNATFLFPCFSLPPPFISICLPSSKVSFNTSNECFGYCDWQTKNVPARKSCGMYRLWRSDPWNFLEAILKVESLKTSVLLPWNFDIPLILLWNTHQASLKHPWNLLETPLNPLWNFLETSLEFRGTLKKIEKMSEKVEKVHNFIDTPIP